MGEGDTDLTEEKILADRFFNTNSEQGLVSFLEEMNAGKELWTKVFSIICDLEEGSPFQREYDLSDDDLSKLVGAGIRQEELQRICKLTQDRLSLVIKK